MRLMWAVAVAPAEVLARAPAGTPRSPEKQIPIRNSYQKENGKDLIQIKMTPDRGAQLNLKGFRS